MSPSNLADMKISHALALSTLLFGEQGEAFRLLNDDIQDTVHWLLNVTLREAVAAMHGAPSATESDGHV